jgi:hypothetical protein
VARLRHHDHAFRLGGGVEHLPRQAERDDGIPASDPAEVTQKIINFAKVL